MNMVIYGIAGLMTGFFVLFSVSRKYGCSDLI